MRPIYLDQRRLGRERHFDPRNTKYLVADHLEASTFDTAAALSASRGGPIPEGALAALQGANAGGETVGDAVTDLHFEYHWRGRWAADQSDSPMCTGFSGARQYLAGPITHGTKAEGDLTPLAQQLYEGAVAVDESEGRHFDGGATMLALAKAGQALKLWGGYVWGYTLADFVTAIRQQPVLLGIDWWEGMDEPAPHYGVIRKTGRIRGGHAIMAVGANLATGYVTLLNTWGRSWGLAGAALLPFEDLESLIADGGEVLVVREEVVKP